MPEVWQTLGCRAMHNLYEQFRQLIPDPPLQAGTVMRSSAPASSPSPCPAAA